MNKSWFFNISFIVDSQALSKENIDSLYVGHHAGTSPPLTRRGSMQKFWTFTMQKVLTLMQQECGFLFF